ncbi:MAG: TrpR-like protein [Lachnospiraceae bacterium]|nr:TrpR-like protein [Lachnospiraceae bacterium]
MARRPNKRHGEALYEAIMELKDIDECIRFFNDLCSITELSSIEQRFEVARLLSEGQVYTDIMERTGASSATISRVNRVLNYGKDGLHDVLERQKAKE